MKRRRIRVKRKPFTVLDLVSRTGCKATNKDMELLGMNVLELYRMTHDKDPDKVWQIEKGKEIKVNCYPDKFRGEAVRVVCKYFNIETFK